MSDTPTINSNTSYPQSSYQDQGDNSAGLVTPYKVNSGVSRGVQQLGGSSLIADAGNSNITVIKNVPQVLMGNQSTFGEGFYVTKDGVDVTTNTDSNQFIFNSNQNVFKIVGSATFPSIPTTGPTTTTTIAHNLNYIPAVIAYTVVGGLYRLMPHTQMNTADGTISYYAYVSVDNVNLYIVFQYNNGVGPVGSTIPVKYYLLQETAN